jgi:flagellar FliJ protein
VKRSQRIQAIVTIKEQQENQALVVLGEHQRKVQAAQQQLEQLQIYRQDYLTSQNISGSQSIQRLVEFRAFIAQLDVAINKQSDVVKQLQTESLQLHKRWEGLHQQTHNLEKVCAGFLAKEAQVAYKREQTESDDHAARMSMNSPNGI